MEWRARQVLGPLECGREEKSEWGHAKLVVPASCVFQEEVWKAGTGPCLGSGHWADPEGWRELLACLDCVLGGLRTQFLHIAGFLLDPGWTQSTLTPPRPSTGV